MLAGPRVHRTAEADLTLDEPRTTFCNILCSDACTLVVERLDSLADLAALSRCTRPSRTKKSYWNFRNRLPHPGVCTMLARFSLIFQAALSIATGSAAALDGDEPGAAHR